MINQIEPWITNKEISMVSDCIKSTFVTEGNYTDLFEKSVQNLHKTKHQPVAYANATSALYASLKVLEIEPGQEVIIPSLTFTATANAVIMAGGVPVCIDINKSFSMVRDDLLSAISSKTFAIMPTHLYGHMEDVREIKKICKKNKIYLIEDASQGVSVNNKNIYAGTIGDIGVLSFYGNKLFTSAQGAMVISNSIRLLNKLKKFKNHGRAKKGTFWHETIGFNFCISDLHSALGYSQILRANEIKSKKHHIFKIYEANLKQHDNFYLDKLSGEDPSYWFISAFCHKAKDLEMYLRKNNVETRRAFPILKDQPCYRNFGGIKFYSHTNAKKIYKTYLSLPSSANIKEMDIIYICKLINKFYHD